MKSILVILFKIVIIIKVIIVIMIFIIVIIVISNLVTDTEPSNGAVSEAVALFATLLNIGQVAIINQYSCLDDSQGYGWPGSNREVCKSHKSSQSLALCSRTTLLIVIMLILMMKMVFMMMLVILMMKVMAVMLPLAVCRHTTLIGIITCCSS